MKLVKKLLFSKQSVLSWILILIIITLVSGHWLVPTNKRQTFRIFQFDSESYDKGFYACETVTGLTAFPNVNWEKKTNSFTTVDTEITKGGSNLSIEVEGDTAKVLTDTAVESGIAVGDDFNVLRNDDNTLSLGFESEVLAGNWGINLISINKKTGLGIWTKTKLRDDLFGNPSGQVYYLKCL